MNQTHLEPLAPGVSQSSSATSNPSSRSIEKNSINTRTFKSDRLPASPHTDSRFIIEKYLCALIWLCASIFLAPAADAQTSINGDITTTIWIPAGNPYIVGSDSTVLSGHTLTIKPGVIVWLGSNVSLTVNGSIQAIGSPGGNPTNRITLKSFAPTQYWNAFQLHYSGAVNRFKYCDFQNANTAISMNVSGGNVTMVAEIMNCTFSNCLEQAVFGQAHGNAGTFFNQYAVLNPVIKNCYFNAVGGGCRFYLDGVNAGFWGIGYGYGGLQCVGNVFRNITNAAISLEVGGYAGESVATVINNTIVNCRIGVDLQNPWNARVQNNIFVGATNAVRKTGSLSLTTGYNDFFGNITNFTGYPPSYGQWIIPNRNGTLADPSFNISQDPQFIGASDFHLASGSRCIDAGTPDTAFCDLCLSSASSQGTQLPDLGAYGGPDACNWLDIVPRLPVTASMSTSDNVIRLNWDAIPRSEYQVQYITNLALVGTNNWRNFPNGRVVATGKPTSFPVATDTTESKAFFRVQSLGRTPGN